MVLANFTSSVSLCIAVRKSFSDCSSCSLCKISLLVTAITCWICLLTDCSHFVAFSINAFALAALIPLMADNLFSPAFITAIAFLQNTDTTIFPVGWLIAPFAFVTCERK
jgi:hypothetical protein